MKTADEYRKEFVFGKCPGEAHGHIFAGSSLHCGNCLTETFARAIADARRAALEEAAAAFDATDSEGRRWAAYFRALAEREA